MGVSSGVAGEPLARLPWILALNPLASSTVFLLASLMSRNWMILVERRFNGSKAICLLLTALSYGVLVVITAVMLACAAVRRGLSAVSFKAARVGLYLAPYPVQ